MRGLRGEGKQRIAAVGVVITRSYLIYRGGEPSREEMHCAPAGEMCERGVATHLSQLPDPSTHLNAPFMLPARQHVRGEEVRGKKSRYQIDIRTGLRLTLRSLSSHTNTHT